MCESNAYIKIKERIFNYKNVEEICYGKNGCKEGGIFISFLNGRTHVFVEGATSVTFVTMSNRTNIIENLSYA